MPVKFLCPLSTDLFGNQLAGYLEENCVDISLCPRKEGQTTLAFVSLPKEGHEEPQFAFYSNGAVDRSLKIEQVPEQFGEETLTLHFGSISLLMEPGASAYQELMRRESRQRVLSLDPNVRPAVIEDRNDFCRKFEQWAGLVDLLRLSDADLAYMHPEKQIEELLPGWFEKGITLVLLTKGAEGARGFTESGLDQFVPAEKVKIQDTVGAGDTFLSAALTYLFEHEYLKTRDDLSQIDSKHLSDCLSFAVKAAAINCTREGASPPYRHEMK